MNTAAPILSQATDDAEVHQNLKRILDYSQSLRRPPLPATAQTSARVAQLLDVQAQRLAGRAQLAPLAQAIAGLRTPRPCAPQPSDNRVPSPGTLSVGSSDCPLVIRAERDADAAPHDMRRHTALSMLVKTKFSQSCVAALLRHDKDHKLDYVLTQAASRALFFRAHKRLLGAAMAQDVYTGLLRVVGSIWRGGVDPDTTIADEAEDFVGTLLEQAITLGDKQAIRLLLEPLWPIVDRKFAAYEHTVQTDLRFKVGTPFIDAWMELILASPVLRHEPACMTAITTMLVGDVCRRLTHRSQAMRAHYVEQTLIKIASCKNAAVFKAALRGFARHDYLGVPDGMQDAMHFCILAVWPEGVEALLDAGFAPDTRLTTAWMVMPGGHIGQTPLSLAASLTDAQHFDSFNVIIDMLLARGSDPRVGSCRPVSGGGSMLVMTPMHFALESGNLVAARRLLEAEMAASNTFVRKDRRVLAKLERAVRCTFYSRQGAPIEPDDRALRALTHTLLQATLDNFHLQNGSDEASAKGFGEIGSVAIMAAEYIDTEEWAQHSRARRKTHALERQELVRRARALSTHWPKISHIPLPCEYAQETSLVGVHATDLFSVEALAESLNNLFLRLISMGDPCAAGRFLTLYPKLASRHLCIGAALSMRRASDKEAPDAHKRSFAHLLQHIAETMQAPDGVRIMLEIACVCQDPEALQRILAAAQNASVAWYTSPPQPFVRNVMHMAVDASQPMVQTLLEHMDTASRRAWLLGQDEQGDTPLHLAARHKQADYETLLKAIDTPDAYRTENIAGRDVATEALLHGHLALFRRLLQSDAPPVACHTWGQAFINQPRTRRLSFLQSLERQALLDASHDRTLGALFAHLMARGDVHALRTAMGHYARYVMRAQPNETNVLHLAAASQSSGMLRALKSQLSPAQLAAMARCKNAEQLYPEDLAETCSQRKFLNDLRTGAKHKASLAYRSKDIEGLATLVEGIGSDADGMPRDKEVARFVARAEALAALPKTSKSDTDAINQLSWQLLDILATSPGPGCGVHFAAHRPDVSRQQLERRLYAFGSQGASRFGAHDGLLLLRTREAALTQARSEPRDEMTAGFRSVIEWHDVRLKGEGFVRNQTTGLAVPYEASPYVRFVMAASAEGQQFIVSWYPIADRT